MWQARKQNACGRVSRSVYTVVDGVVWMLQDHKAEGETEMTEIYEIIIGFGMEYIVISINCLVSILSKGKFILPNSYFRHSSGK